MPTIPKATSPPQELERGLSSDPKVQFIKKEKIIGENALHLQDGPENMPEPENSAHTLKSVRFEKNN